VRGYQLRKWRYSHTTDQQVKEALDRESWNGAQWQAWRQPKLTALLRRAATRVPYYRDLWSSRPHERREFESLQNWPVLKKSALREQADAFLAEDVDPNQLGVLHTSGSTGTPLKLWQSRQTVQAWYALFEARWRAWHGLSRHDRWAILGGKLVVSAGQQGPPFWVWNAGMNQLYLSSYHLAPNNAAVYVKALADHKVTYIWGYASAMATLARDVLEQGLRPPQLRAAISNAEPLYAYQRDLITRAFGCRVYDTYGMTEMACGASECEHGSMHLWPDAGIWEVLSDDSDTPVPPGKSGRLVCTGLINNDMPLIRYEVGDRVTLADPAAVCSCGRKLPMLKSVEGRNDDTIITPNGRHVGRLDPVFKSDFPIVEAQVIQDAPDHLLVQIVPAPGCNAATESALIAALAERAEGMRIDVRRVSAIPRGPNGKFKSVLRVPFESERQDSRTKSASAKSATRDLRGSEHVFDAEEVRAAVDVNVAAVEEQISRWGI
jgi:phenylacetate-coenzyme A ligase PaaK-like adenylate-forming protein